MNDYRGFTVPGEPIGKGRPKFSTAGGYAKAYTPAKTVNYENLVKLMYQYKHGNKKLYDKDVNLRIIITAFFQIPKSASKVKTSGMIKGAIRPTKKPDTDNVAKAICDALNGIAYHDDAQIVELTVKKYYGESPETKIEIMEVET